MAKRIIFNLVLIGAIFYTPWWAVAILAFVGAFLFPFYYEIFAVGVLFDLLYGVPTHFARVILGIIATIVLFIVARRLKRAVR